MKRGLQVFRWGFLALVASVLSLIYSARGQVAITEMMSARYSPADFFELTNFGTNTADLTGYKFTDADHRRARLLLVPSGEILRLHPGKSILFMRHRTNTIDEVQFRAFWGPCLDPGVQVRSFERPGFSSFGDSLMLYDAFDKLVDTIDFGRAPRTYSFIYDPTTGVFGVPSTLANGGCLSVTNSNLASPGRTSGPIPLKIVRQPVSVIACQQLDAVFSVEALGMPRPRYQWLFNGEPLPEAEEPVLIIPNASPNDEGSYSVRVSNGLTNIVSEPAALSLSTDFSAPSIVFAPSDITVVEGRAAHFSIGACAFPPPSYEWSSEGVVLPGETNRIFQIPFTSRSMSGGRFCVRVTNPFGSELRCATLYVTNTSPIRITELQARPLPGCDGHNDWFEISNYGSTDVDLIGYRFSDTFDLEGANTIRQHVILRPHESVICVKNSSVGTFFDWWGPEQLPPDLQVIPYSGFALGADGDTLVLWNAEAQDSNEYLDSIVYSGNSPGRTLDFQILGASHESLPDVGGTIRAVECGDVGTPGFTLERPRLTEITRTARGVRLTWRGAAGVQYFVEFSDSITSPWKTLGEPMATSLSTGIFIDDSPSNSGNRFYRVVRTLPLEW